MQQLTGLDEMFLSVDTTTTTGVMGGLVVYEAPDGSTDPGAGGAAALTARITERLDQLPFLRRRLVKVPLGLDHAYWQDGVDVDVPAHVHVRELPAPGSDREVADAVADVMATPLPTDRPLWEVHVLTGLSEGRIAHLYRVHHGVIDGTTIPVVLDLLSDEPSTPLGPPTAADPDVLTGRVGMLLRGLVGTATRPGRFLELQIATVEYLAGRRDREGALAPVAFLGRLLPGPLGAPLRGVANLRQRRVGGAEVRQVTPGLRRPRTPFNGRLDARRTYAFSELPLADVKRVGKAYGATLNDVVLAVVAGALRRYLDEHGGVPDRPLRVCIPASLRTGDEQPRWANHVSMFFAPLPTHLADPVDRLRTVSADVRDARTQFQALPTHLIRAASEFVPMAVWSIPQRILTRAPGWVPTSAWNVVVSNVKGPTRPVRITGATMAGYWPAAFLTMGVGLNVTLQSYRDRIDIGFMGAANLVDDVWELPRYVADALAELEAALPPAEPPVEPPAVTATEPPAVTAPAPAPAPAARVPARRRVSAG